jgi:mono/diheme cytochrome c family protein
LTKVNERCGLRSYPWQASSRRGEVAVPSTTLPETLRRALIVGLAFVALCFALPAQAAEKSLIDKGEALVKKNCSPCHAIGKEGDSPHKEAPPFRTLSAKYPIEDLAESLAEGIVSGHPDMPIFVFSPHDVEAIIQYMESIQAQ